MKSVPLIIPERRYYNKGVDVAWQGLRMQQNMESKQIAVYRKEPDDSGAIQTVTDIVVNYTEEKNYCGISSREYGCKAIIGGLNREFRLIFYQENCRWVMLV